MRFLAVGEHPDVGGDAGVVEELVRQRDDCLEPVVLYDPAADVALASAGVAGQQRGAVEDDGDAAAAGAVVFGGLHLGEHVLQEQQRTVGDPGQSRSEAAVPSEGVVLFGDGLLLLLPLDPEGWVRQHVVERRGPAVPAAAVAVFGECVAEDDVVGVVALYEHVGLADGPSFAVPVLAVENGVRFAVVVAQVLLGHGQHAAGPAGGVIDRLDDVALAQVRFRRQQQVHHQLDDLARGEVLAGLFVGLLRSDADQFLEDIPHLHVVDPLRRQVQFGEPLDDLEELVVLVHARYLLAKPEAVHNLADIA